MSEWSQSEAKNEVATVALLCTKSHPNIVEVFDHGPLSHVYYFIDMELCQLSLAELLRRKTRTDGFDEWYLQWPIEDFEDRLFFIVALMQELGNGLYFIHFHDKVHRDIKPENSNYILPCARTNRGSLIFCHRWTVEIHGFRNYHGWYHHVSCLDGGIERYGLLRSARAVARSEVQ